LSGQALAGYFLRGNILKICNFVKKQTIMKATIKKNKGKPAVTRESVRKVLDRLYGDSMRKIVNKKAKEYAMAAHTA
jgi:hypothetical protein